MRHARMEMPGDVGGRGWRGWWGGTRRRCDGAGAGFFGIDHVPRPIAGRGSACRSQGGPGKLNPSRAPMAMPDPTWMGRRRCPNSDVRDARAATLTRVPGFGREPVYQPDQSAAPGVRRAGRTIARAETATRAARAAAGSRLVQVDAGAEHLPGRRPQVLAEVAGRGVASRRATRGGEGRCRRGSGRAKKKCNRGGHTSALAGEACGGRRDPRCSAGGAGRAHRAAGCAG